MTNRTKLIYEDLMRRYKRATISKAEYANELGVSISTVDRQIANSFTGLPPYKKLGNAKNSKVVFNIIDVAEFLADDIKQIDSSYPTNLAKQL